MHCTFLLSLEKIKNLEKFEFYYTQRNNINLQMLLVDKLSYKKALILQIYKIYLQNKIIKLFR